MHLKLHNVCDGPYEDDEGGFFLVALTEHGDGTVENVEFYFETLEECYSIVSHFKTSIEPIIMEVDQCSTSSLN